MSNRERVVCLSEERQDRIAKVDSVTKVDNVKKLDSPSVQRLRKRKPIKYQSKGKDVIVQFPSQRYTVSFTTVCSCKVLYFACLTDSSFSDTL